MSRKSKPMILVVCGLMIGLAMLLLAGIADERDFWLAVAAAVVMYAAGILSVAWLRPIGPDLPLGSAADVPDLGPLCVESRVELDLVRRGNAQPEDPATHKAR